jgi:hypothetical protein
MADIYGSNYQKEFINEPKEAANVGEYNGKQRVAIDSFSGAAGGDDVYCAKLPANAFILNLSAIGAGTSPVFNVAVGDKLSSEQDIVCTLDGDAAASGKIWVEYSLD